MSLFTNQAHRAVLFDFDGVIGRTMEDNYQAWCKAFETIGIVLDQTEYYQLEGLNTIRLAETILKMRSLDMSGAIILAQLKEAYYLANNNFALYPGVEKLLHLLKQHYVLGLVTGAGRERLQRTIDTDLLDCFSVVVTGDLVSDPKPAPEPYLKAAAMIGVSPEDCLVVENAPLGIRSAKAAGMTCIAICSTLSPEDLTQADQIVADIPALAALLQANLTEKDL